MANHVFSGVTVFHEKQCPLDLPARVLKKSLGKVSILGAHAILQE
jgi:hypothetical protein